MNLPDMNAHDKLFYGLDLGKRESQLALLSSDAKQLVNCRFRTTRENLVRAATHLRPTDTIALEVSTSARGRDERLQAQLRSEGDPLQSDGDAGFAHGRTKTDKVDARVLAELTRVDYLPEVWQPDRDTTTASVIFIVGRR